MARESTGVQKKSKSRLEDNSPLAVQERHCVMIADINALALKLYDFKRKLEQVPLFFSIL